MAESMNHILHPASNTSIQGFPHAPEGWSKTLAEANAYNEGITIDEAHWEIIRALQEYYDNTDTPHIRELHDALEEKFHHKGGLKYVFQVMPGGPVAQGCKLAGLPIPPGSIDPSFGSVQ